MQRAEKIGLGASATGHLLLLLALSLGILAHPRPLPDMHEAMDVELVSAIAPNAAAKKAVAPAPTPAPAPSPEEPAPAPPTPKPAAPPPKPPEPAPKPKPEPKPVPVPKPKPVEKPVPKPKPVPEKPKPAPEKPKPEAKPKAEAKPTKPAPAAKPTPTKQKLDKNFLKGITDGAKPAAAPGKGTTATAKPKSERIGKDFLAGLSTQAKKEAAGSPARKVSALQLAGLINAIREQVKPCYHPPSGGTDSAQIVSLISMKMKPDGSVATLTITDHSGVTDSNRAYVQQMDDAARRAVLRCSPFKDLPAELYRGGWEDFDFRFRPEQMQ